MRISEQLGSRWMKWQMQDPGDGNRFNKDKKQPGGQWGQSPVSKEETEGTMCIYNVWKQFSSQTLLETLKA